MKETTLLFLERLSPRSSIVSAQSIRARKLVALQQLDGIASATAEALKVDYINSSLPSKRGRTSMSSFETEIIREPGLAIKIGELLCEAIYGDLAQQKPYPQSTMEAFGGLREVTIATAW
jgi:hypothetical protein